MGMNTKIEWCEHTWNPWYGCPDDGKRSPACDHCYARAWAKRSGLVDFDRQIKRAADKTFMAPLDREKYKSGDKVFVCSLSDVAHYDVPQRLALDMWDVVKKRSDLIWLFLSKRPEEFLRLVQLSRGSKIYDGAKIEKSDLPENWWFGVTVENQEQADKRIPLLLDIPAAVRFVSVEPMLGAVELERGRYWLTAPGPRLDLVIVGKETGAGARRCELGWVHDLSEQCRKSGVAYFAKKLPAECNPPANWMRREFPEEEK